MHRLVDHYVRDRRRAQSGATLVELLVGLVIIGFALVILIGTFSTGLLDATIAKRDTAAEAVVQYELEKIGASPYSASPQSYSECFASVNLEAPFQVATFQGSCPATTYSFRADVQSTAGLTSSSQAWTVTDVTWPSGGQVGRSVSTLKVDR